MKNYEIIISKSSKRMIWINKEIEHNLALCEVINNHLNKFISCRPSGSTIAIPQLKVIVDLVIGVISIEEFYGDD